MKNQFIFITPKGEKKSRLCNVGNIIFVEPIGENTRIHTAIGKLDLKENYIAFLKCLASIKAIP